ncbi:MAG: hypothetical protein AAF539_06180 [Planctomycetota bacterium]
MATYYVSPTGAGLQDGSSEANAWSLATALTQNTVAQDTIHLASGDYLFANTLDFPDGMWIGAGVDSTRFLATASMTEGIVLNVGTIRLQDCTITDNGNTVTRLVESKRYSGIRDCKIIGGVTGLRVSDASAHQGVVRNELLGQANRSIDGAGKTTAVIQCKMEQSSEDAGFVQCVLQNAFASRIVSGCVFLADVDQAINSISVTGSPYITDGDGVQTPIDDPFVDSANYDLRLTSEAKLSSESTMIRAIMAGLVDVPGVTTDSLQDLIGSSASNPNYHPLAPQRGIMGGA